jgi:hypothetical protein
MKEKTKDIVVQEAYNVAKRSMIDAINENTNEESISKALGISPDEFDENLGTGATREHFYKLNRAENYPEAIKYCLEDSPSLPVFTMRVMTFARWIEYKKDLHKHLMERILKL